MGISTRVNGVAPPDVPLSEINLGEWEFWAQDDDLREGAFATLRREDADLVAEVVRPRGATGRGPLGAHQLRRRLSRQQAPRDLQFQPGHHHRRSEARIGRVLRFDDRDGRSPPHPASQHRAQRVHAAGARAHRGFGARPRPAPGDDMLANHPDGRADLVTELAGPLPLQIICDMMGIPEEDHQQVFHWTNVILGFGDPDISTDFDEFVAVAMDIGAYATALADDRRATPRRRSHHEPGAGRTRR